MQVKNVGFLLTFKCLSICSHCSYKAGPTRVGCMDLVDAEKWMGELVGNQSLQRLTIHGGEPFIYFEVLKNTINKAWRLKIPQIWIITNAYWADTKETALAKLEELREVGLSSITFSADAFHQEHIPLESIRYAIQAAQLTGFEKITIDSYVLHAETGNDSFRDKLQDLLDFPNVKFSKYPVRFDGRAAESLANYIQPQPEVPKGKCQLPSRLGGDLQNPQGIEIDWQGNVTLCPGLCIGNAKVKPLTQVLAEYDYEKHPIISIIAEQGPIGLMNLARDKGYDEKQEFINGCHLCYEMRKFLRPYYPEYLAPETCY